MIVILVFLTVDCFWVIQCWRMTALEQVPVIHPSVTGMERETADHFLLRCSRYSEARSVMKNYIYEMCFTDNKKRQSKLYGSILLAPAWDSGVTKKADREIKNALFQFLKTVKRKFSLSIILQYSHNCLIYWCVVLLWCYSLCSKIYLQSYKCLQFFDSIWAPLATTLTTDLFLLWKSLLVFVTWHDKVVCRRQQQQQCT